MNLAGGYFQYNYSPNGEDADMHAIYRDWKIIGDQIDNVTAEEIQKTENSQLQLALA